MRSLSRGVLARDVDAGVRPHAAQILWHADTLASTLSRQGARRTDAAPPDDQAAEPGLDGPRPAGSTDFVAAGELAAPVVAGTYDPLMPP